MSVPGYEERLDMVEDVMDGNLSVADAVDYEDQDFVDAVLGEAYDAGWTDDQDGVLYVERGPVEAYGIDALRAMDRDIPEEFDLFSGPRNAFGSMNAALSTPYRKARGTGERVFDADSEVGGAMSTVADRLDRPLDYTGLALLSGGIAALLMNMPLVNAGALGSYVTLRGGKQVMDGLADGARATRREARWEEMVEDIGSYRVETVPVPEQFAASAREE